jgi:hypothetical protein
MQGKGIAIAGQPLNKAKYSADWILRARRPKYLGPGGYVHSPVCFDAPFIGGFRIPNFVWIESGTPASKYIHACVVLGTFLHLRATIYTVRVFTGLGWPNVRR